MSAWQPCGRRLRECIDDVCRSMGECAWPPDAGVARFTGWLGEHTSSPAAGAQFAEGQHLGDDPAVLAGWRCPECGEPAREAIPAEGLGGQPVIECANGHRHYAVPGRDWRQ